MAAFKTLDDIGNISGKRVLVRVDLNVPVADGKVTDATRIERIAPTIAELSGKGAKVILLAHFGRPKDGPSPEFSLEPIARATADVLGRPVGFATRLRRRHGGERRRRHEQGRRAAARKHPLLQGRGEERPGLHRKARRQWRHLRQRRLLRRASRPLLDRGAGASLAGLRRPHHAGRTRSAGEGPRQSGPSGRRHRRRRQGLDQDRPADEPGEEGRRAGHRRRHGQHLPRRARHRCRQVAVRA